MKKILLFAFLFFFPLITTEAWAAEVIIFKTAEVAAYNQAIAGFREIVPGVEITEENMDNDIEVGGRIIERIKRRKPAAILAVGAKAAELSSREISVIPIVFCMVMAPEKYGIKGENITGVSMEVPPKAQFSTLKSILPFLKSIGVIYDPKESGRLIDEGKTAAEDLGLELIAREVISREEIAGAMKELIEKVDALWLVPDTTVVTRESFKYMLSSTIKKGIPLLVFSDGFVKGGAFLSLSPDYFSVGREAGNLVKKILRGTSPQSLPLIHPEGKLSINMSTARDLGIEIPEGIKRRAKIY